MEESPSPQVVCPVAGGRNRRRIPAQRQFYWACVPGIRRDGDRRVMEWVRRAEADGGVRAGVIIDERAW